MRTSVAILCLALVVGCASRVPKPPDVAVRNRIQVQGFATPPSQTFDTYSRALLAEKYKVDNSHQARGMIIGRMQGGQIKRDVFVQVYPTASGSQARTSIQQTQPFDLGAEGGREYFYPPLYQRIYKGVRDPASLNTAKNAVAPAVAPAPAGAKPPATAPFFRKTAPPPAPPKKR